METNLDERPVIRTLGASDAIFITSSSEIEFLKTSGLVAFQDAWLIPLSFDALGSALRSGHPKIFDHLSLVDFDLCVKGYHRFEAQSKSWLSELGLAFEVDGIDIVARDAPSQFLLFSQASYIESLAARAIAGLALIETFYVLTSPEPLVLDFYFDSDTAAAVVQFVCQRSKRACKTVPMTGRRLKFAAFPERPFLGRKANHTGAQTSQTDFSVFKVGMCPGGMADYQSVAEEVRRLGYQSLIFNSSWGLEWGLGNRAGETLLDLAALAQPSDDGTKARLSRIWNELNLKRGQSSLIDAVIRNPYLDYQLRYVVTERWLRLASLARAATKAAKEIPLELFICCELSHDEGAILAAAYRNAGAKILVVPHSGWPCDRTWSHWNPADTAVTRTRSAADRLRRVSKVSRTFVLGSTPPEAVVKAKKRAVTDRRIVVVLTNALELLDTPFVAPSDHVKSMSIFCGMPEHLSSKILIAVRAKPGVLSEDTILYKRLAGISEESVTFLNGLTFSECLQLADCVVGMNLPTSGYFEILECGVPLIHVQMAEVTTKHPDLPPTVVQQVTKAEDLWPRIESVLFDPDFREQTIERQRQFIQLDLTPNFEAGSSPLQSVIQHLMAENRGPRGKISRFFSRLRSKFIAKP